MSACAASGFWAVRLHVVFRTSPVFHSFVKDGLSFIQSTSLVYKFKRQCKSDYVGRTNQRHEIWIGQHVPANIRQATSNCSICDIQSVHDSAISQHLQIVQQNTVTICSLLCAELGSLNICNY